jgi:hypothetical protein
MNATTATAAAESRPLLSPRVRRKLRSALCVAWNGGHELYRAHDDTRMFQKCVHCEHETQGWTVDRMDRRLHR